MSVEFWKNLENLLRAGDFSKVAKALHSLNAKKIPRGDLARAANIANRVDQPRLAFRWLNPVIRGDKALQLNPTDAERIEYAEALRRMGLVNEAIEIFQSLDANRFPLVHLRLAFCLFKKWQYADAVPHLRELLKVVPAADYLATIGKVNLAAALVHERHNMEALDLLVDLRRSTRQANQLLLLGNSLELSAQVYIACRDFESAGKVLREAQALFENDGHKYALFVNKWMAISESLQTGRVDDRLHTIREEALNKEDWETVRDCDLYIGAIAQDRHILERVYFGTPHASFRKRIEELTGGKLDVPDSYLWCSSEGPKHEFDLLAGASVNGSAQLEAGRLMHQFVILLCSDFYRPVTIGSAFSMLFPSEHFAQHGSANRVSQIVMRLREWCAEFQPGFQIVGTDGRYRLQLEKDSGIRVPRDIPAPSVQEIQWRQVRAQLRGNSFTRQHISEISKCSPAGAKRLLKWAISNGRVTSTGSGPKVRYFLAA